jgi:drug/metabolite transporter (DMT)-like permease
VPATALALVLAAAVIHTAWNALAKRAGDPFLFLWSAFSCASVATLPVAVWQLAEAGLDRRALIFLAATGSIHAVYFYALGAAYRRADFSQVYPVARGLGVALVPLPGIFLLGERLSLLGAAGVLGVAGGISALALARPAGAQQSAPRTRGLGWALLTGTTTAAYSLNDKVGVRYMHPVRYICFLGLGSMSLLVPAVLRRRAALVEEWRKRRGTILVAALLSSAAYLLVLLAFRLSKAAYVVAGRELSIVLSTVVGGLWLGEGWPRLRLLGSALILAGVVCVGLAR